MQSQFRFLRDFYHDASRRNSNAALFRHRSIRRISLQLSWRSFPPTAVAEHRKNIQPHSPQYDGDNEYAPVNRQVERRATLFVPKRQHCQVMILMPDNIKDITMKMILFEVAVLQFLKFIILSVPYITDFPIDEKVAFTLDNSSTMVE